MSDLTNADFAKRIFIFLSVRDVELYIVILLLYIDNNIKIYVYYI